MSIRDQFQYYKQISITNNFDEKLKKILDGFDFYEEYDPNKSYGYGSFQKEYNNNIYTYSNVLYEIIDVSNNKKYKYVCARNEYSNEQIETMKKYCRCEYHMTSSFNIMKYIMCKCCVGCIDSISPNVDVLEKTKKYMKKINKWK